MVRFRLLLGVGLTVIAVLSVFIIYLLVSSRRNTPVKQSVNQLRNSSVLPTKGPPSYLFNTYIASSGAALPPKYFPTIERYAKTAPGISVNGCILNPPVYKTKPDKEIVFQNADAIPHIIDLKGTYYTIPPKQSIKTPGLPALNYMYLCDGSQAAGWILVRQ